MSRAASRAAGSGGWSATGRTTRAALAALVLAGAARGGECVAVAGERVQAAELAAAVPALAALAPQTPLLYAPAPGARRTLSVAELARLTARYGIQAPPVEVCLERRVAPLQPDEILAALRKAVGRQDARIELVDFSRYPMPPGELEFSLSGLSRTVTGPALWRGRLRYDGSRTLPVWARVHIRAPGRRLVAAEDLPAGRRIAPTGLRVEQGEWYPFGETPLEAPEQAVGRIPRRRIPAGAVLYARMLSEPREIERGQTVLVEVASGGTQLRFSSRAESGGRTGDVIMVRNPANGRRLAARVAGPGKAVVDAGMVDHGGRGAGGRGR